MTIALPAEVRFILLMCGMIGSAALATYLWTIPHTIARIFSIVMVVWSINCIVLATMLGYWIVSGDYMPSWRDALCSGNAVILSATPAGAYVYIVLRIRRGGSA